MSNDYGFKFAIGSFVRLAVSANQQHNGIAWGRDSHVEHRGQIVERSLIESAIGAQLNYAIRWVRANGDPAKDLMWHNEIELVASEAFPANVEVEK